MKDNCKKSRKILRYHKLIFLSILLILLLSSSYAWFLFAIDVSTSFTSKVIAWDVKFSANSMLEDETVEIKVDNMYPGMPVKSEEIKVTNNGDISAELSYKITGIEIFGSSFEVGDNITQEELDSMFEEEIPFSVTITTSNDTVEAATGESSFLVTVEWPYESGNDEMDTEWGEAAYEFKQTNGSDPSFILKLTLQATQVSS